MRQRYRLDDAGWSALRARLAVQDGRGAIVGAHGSGKTTLIEDLGARLVADGLRVHWIRLNDEHRAVQPELCREHAATLGPRDAVLVDGAEQLGVRAWWVLCLRVRRAGVFVATTHRGGRLPTVYRCATSVDLLRQLVAELGESISVAEAAALHARHRGNIREALRELYDVAATREPGVISSGPAA